MEVVGVTKANFVGNFYHRHIGIGKIAHSAVYSYRIYVIYRGLAHAFLENFGEIVGAYGYHIRELLYR